MTTDQTDQKTTDDPDVRSGIDLRTNEGLYLLLDRLRTGFAQSLASIPDEPAFAEARQDAAFLVTGVDSIAAELRGQAQIVRSHVVEMDRLCDAIQAIKAGSFPAMEAELKVAVAKLRDSVPASRLENAYRAMNMFADESRRHAAAASLVSAALAAATRHNDQLVVELQVAKEEHQRACETVAKMHAAAMGRACGPVLGVVEDVSRLRHDYEQAEFACRSALSDRDAMRAQMEVALNERDMARTETASFAHDLDHTQQLLAAANDERDRLTQRIAANKGDVTKLSMELEALRDSYRPLVDAVHGLLATLDDVSCPHGLGIRQTVATLASYDGRPRGRIPVEDVQGMDLLQRLMDMENRVARLETGRVVGRSADTLVVDDFDGVTPVPAGEGGPRLKR